MKKLFIIISIFLLLFTFSGVGKANTYLEEFSTQYNFSQIELENEKGQNFEVEFLLLTLDMLRTYDFEFFSPEAGRSLRRNIVFNVFVENKSDSELSFNLNNIKLLLGDKEITPIIVDNIDPSFKYSRSGTIGFPLEEISDINFAKLKLVVENKKSKESIDIYRDDLKYDFNEKFRSDFPDEKIEDRLSLKYLITNRKLGYLDESNKLKEKNNFNRNSIDEIIYSLHSNISSDIKIKAEWYNNKGFHKEEVIKTNKPKKIEFALSKDEFEKDVGNWSILIYIDNNLIIHETFLVY